MGSDMSRPRQNYVNVAEMQSDYDLKRQLFECIPRDSGFGKRIAELDRPITVDEIHEIYRVIRACDKKREASGEAAF